MSTQAPQVLSRRANGVLPAPASQSGESTKGKGSHDHSSPGKPRGRGPNARSTEATKNATEGETPKQAKVKVHNEGEKLVIRRLPPGMTLTEFMSILGSDWEVGKGRIDWFSFAPGKISTDPSKPSRPGRAYVHVTRKEHIMALSDAVRTAVWEDAKATFTSPSLIGPPAVEFALYRKVPGNKKRTDARQGTIDQDPEFMAFLEDLANPAPPKDGLEGEEADDMAKAETRVTTTPLIEYLKEKKANKTKDGASSKNAKHGESRSGKGKSASKDDEPSKKKGKESKADKAERTPKETVKILTKKANTDQGTEATKNTPKQASDTSAQEPAPKSRRAGILAAARILQRDLGLSPGSAHRKARQDAAKAEADAKATSKENAPPATATVTATATATATAATAVTTERPASPVKSNEATPPAAKNRSGAGASSKSQSSGRRARGGKNSEKNKDKDKDKEKEKESPSSQAPAPANPPVVLLKKKSGEAESSQSAAPANTESQPPAAQSSGSKPASTSAGGSKGGSNKSGNAQKKPPSVSADATRGFVKHANPSQGVTEALLKQSLEVFGTITFVEIDKRKGFAYVDFAEHEGLVKAVTSSPITVAQGTVQVLERKDKKPANAAAASGASGSAPSEKPSGRGRRGRGGGNKAKDAGASNQGGGGGGAATAPAASSGG